MLDQLADAFEINRIGVPIADTLGQMPQTPSQDQTLASSV